MKNDFKIDKMDSGTDNQVFSIVHYVLKWTTNEQGKLSIYFKIHKYILLIYSASVHFVHFDTFFKPMCLSILKEI